MRAAPTGPPTPGNTASSRSRATAPTNGSVRRCSSRNPELRAGDGREDRHENVLVGVADHVAVEHLDDLDEIERLGRGQRIGGEPDDDHVEARDDVDELTAEAVRRE